MWGLGFAISLTFVHVSSGGWCRAISAAGASGAWGSQTSRGKGALLPGLLPRRAQPRLWSFPSAEAYEKELLIQAVPSRHPCLPQITLQGCLLRLLGPVHMSCFLGP